MWAIQWLHKGSEPVWTSLIRTETREYKSPVATPEDLATHTAWVQGLGILVKISPATDCLLPCFMHLGSNSMIHQLTKIRRIMTLRGRGGGERERPLHIFRATTKQWCMPASDLSRKISFAWKEYCNTTTIMIKFCIVIIYLFIGKTPIQLLLESW